MEQPGSFLFNQFTLYARIVMEKPEPAFTYSQLERSRWNVLDLITIVSKDAVPATVFCDVDMEWVKELKGEFHKKGIRLTETAIFLKAIATAQASFPASRSLALPFGLLAVLERICGGFTVERFVDGKPAVFFGTIDEPHKKDLQAIMQELITFSDNSIVNQPELNTEHRFSKMPWLVRQLIIRMAMVVPRLRLQITRASFGLSSLGKYGVTAITGPCVCTSTFGIGVIEDRPIVRNGEIVIRPTMTLSLLFDQRCIDGSEAARFLTQVKDLLEGGLKKHLSEASKKRIETSSKTARESTDYLESIHTK